MNVAIIPARGGSKRIPRKNIKPFHGKPMIAYSIEAAKASGCFDKIIVSTDVQEIADVVLQYGAEVPFLWSKEIPGDYTGTAPVIKHAIESLAKQGVIPTFVCCIYATAPFVLSSGIKNEYSVPLDTSSKFVFTAASFPFPIQRAFKLSEQNRVLMFQPECFQTRSQDLEDAYHDAEQFYWANREKQLANINNIIFSEASIPIVSPQFLVQDIDTLEDWKQAELMYRTLKIEK